jgi:hypothetical protein
MDLEIIEGLNTYEFHGPAVMSDTMRDYRASRVITVFKADMDCYIFSDLVQEICDVFSLTTKECLHIIERWVENKLGVSVNVAYNEFGKD